MAPSLATLAATTPFCGGVTATSFCPMLDMPRAARSLIGPALDSATCRGIGRGVESRPNARAALRSASAPVLMPSWTKDVLHDLAKASRNDAVGPLPQLEP